MYKNIYVNGHKINRLFIDGALVFKKEELTLNIINPVENEYITEYDMNMTLYKYNGLYIDVNKYNSVAFLIYYSNPELKDFKTFSIEELQQGVETLDVMEYVNMNIILSENNTLSFGLVQPPDYMYKIIVLGVLKPEYLTHEINTSEYNGLVIENISQIYENINLPMFGTRLFTRGNLYIQIDDNNYVFEIPKWDVETYVDGNPRVIKIKHIPPDLYKTFTASPTKNVKIYYK